MVIDKQTASLLIVSGLLQGCFFIEDSSNGQPRPDAPITLPDAPTPINLPDAAVNGFKIAADWRMATTAGLPGTCPSGFDTLQLISEGSGQPISDLFDCATGAGLTASMPPDNYIVRARITNTSLTQVYADSLPFAIDLRLGNAEAIFHFVTDGGYFLVNWTVNAQPASVGCTANGATSVSILSTISGGNTAFEDFYFCGDGYGYTAPLLQGNYTVSLSALNSQDLAIGTAPALVERTIMAPNRVTNLGTIDIPLN